MEKHSRPLSPPTLTSASNTGTDAPPSPRPRYKEAPPPPPLSVHKPSPRRRPAEKVPPRVYRVQPRGFRQLVQRLTGAPRRPLRETSAQLLNYFPDLQTQPQPQSTQLLPPAGTAMPPQQFDSGYFSGQLPLWNVPQPQPTTFSYGHSTISAGAEEVYRVVDASTTSQGAGHERRYELPDQLLFSPLNSRSYSDWDTSNPFIKPGGQL